MTSAVQAESGYDQTAVRGIVRWSAQLGVLQAALVLVFSLATRFLSGTAELAVQGVIVLVGLLATSLLPGTWTRARTIEGIAGAAGIGLGATVMFLILDVALLQPLGTYTNRWLEIGGGSNWWYHPVWWMAGTALAWFGAFALANLTARRGSSEPVRVAIMALVLALALGAVANVIGFPLARWSLGTFAVAWLPALALTVLITGVGRRP